VQLAGERRGGGNGTPLRVAVSVGPQYGTVDAEWVKRAAREAMRGQGFGLLVVCGFAFDAHTVQTAAGVLVPRRGAARGR
jgi:adenine-specific DNA-methyltransferase